MTKADEAELTTRTPEKRFKEILKAIGDSLSDVGSSGNEDN